MCCQDHNYYMTEIIKFKEFFKENYSCNYEICIESYMNNCDKYVTQYVDNMTLNNKNKFLENYGYVDATLMFSDYHKYHPEKRLNNLGDMIKMIIRNKMIDFWGEF